MCEADMWSKASFLTRLVASSVRISETAGNIIKEVMADGDLKIVDKSGQGEPADIQTEADRRAQFLIVNSLTERFGNINIIGEEDLTSECSIVEKSFAVDVLKVENDMKSDLKDIQPHEVRIFSRFSLLHNFSEKVSYLDCFCFHVVVWVDPLDGTAEVAHAVRNKDLALLEQITVLIGVAHRGRAVAGVIHQPYYGDNGRTIWAIKGCGVHGIVPASAQSRRTVVTTRSHLTQSVLDALAALKDKGLIDVVEKFGGAGYKVIKVLEGSAAYVFASPGCKKWDTCAVEAVLSAAGGHLTDISGREICYESTVQRNNTGGVLASAPWEYICSIPKSLKDQLPEIAAKS
ncbi:inositol monophosphatase family protein [Dictyocaulus viviparus]|uniref:3'(2'),5'-bisphosphate nucleotidase 1 n=1 Tax=Dictyocaulus viviparus TaxID=29172 RepID=A0A0D8XVF6_DICVI|nr:inositol monophosphatase family protein [Dictyocaulus viviparus]